MGVRRVLRGGQLTVLVLVVLYSAWTVLVTPAIPVETHWRALAVAAGIGLLGLWGSHLWRSAAAVFFLGFWAVWAFMLPITTAWGPGTRPVVREVEGMASGAVISVALVLLSRGGTDATRVFRWAWILVLVSTGTIAVWEVTTGQHFLVTSTRVWEAPERSPAATFINPNNYACVLALCIGLLLQWMSAVRKAGLRIVLGLLAAVSVALVVLTVSRAALLLVGVQVIIAAILALSRAGVTARMVAWLRQHRAAGTGLFLLVAGSVAALFVVPQLARVNPVLRMLQPTDERVAAADTLRLELTRAGLRYFEQTPWTGTGAGSFEVLLTRERPQAVAILTNMHNSFVELLTQYGLVVTIPLALTFLACLWRVVKGLLPHRVAGQDQATARIQRRQGVDRAGLVAQLVSVLLTVVVAGLIVSSTLTWSLWWVMIANAVALAWALSNTAHAEKASPRPDPSEPQSAPDDRAPLTAGQR